MAFVEKMIHCISDLDHHVWLNLYTDMKMLYLQFLHVTNSDYTVILRHPKNVYALARAIAWYLDAQFLLYVYIYINNTTAHEKSQRTYAIAVTDNLFNKST